MDIKNKIEYWLDIAQYDLASARAMLKALNARKCGDLLKKTEEFYVWTKKLLR